MKRIKRTWACSDCNDGDCSVSRNSEAKKGEDFDAPRIVMENRCLLSPKMFEAHWIEEKRG